MTVLFVLAGFGVVLAVALLAVGRLGELAPVTPDRAPLDLPGDRPLDRADVDGVRFAVGFRGYRMDEVDDMLDRLASDLAARDARIAALEAVVPAAAALESAAVEADSVEADSGAATTAPASVADPVALPGAVPDAAEPAAPVPGAVPDAAEPAAPVVSAHADAAEPAVADVSSGTATTAPPVAPWLAAEADPAGAGPDRPAD